MSIKFQVRRDISNNWSNSNPTPASGNQAGDVYFDSSFGKLRVYSGNVWANVSTA